MVLTHTIYKCLCNASESVIICGVSSVTMSVMSVHMQADWLRLSVLGCTAVKCLTDICDSRQLL